ncbi:GAF domain-containing protein [Phenylobacterium sp. J367]|uniref:GAF domain-containing protein n=1 Tax=Phenylobacterium sp. J367 TaxID=2898435 RepID=UPI00215146D7|nr:GAF domain-containing protein [Phenylobacterium sp. J367]MCR5877486.1 GAF domain-containing protein [Phenylobacterium sp. J367]
MDVALSQRLKVSLVEADRAAVRQIEAGVPLSLILDGLLRAVEGECADDTRTSILLLDPEGRRLLHGAAPSLPEAYNAAIHGIEIGQGVGSCGTAAYLGHPVYVTDIATDPLWVNFKDLAGEHGLRACWSTPVEGEDGRLLGTFAIYHLTPRSPTRDELDAINLVSRSAALAISKQRKINPRCA